jgi:hypothetical protein
LFSLENSPQTPKVKVMVMMQEGKLPYPRSSLILTDLTEFEFLVFRNCLVFNTSIAFGTPAPSDHTLTRPKFIVLKKMYPLCRTHSAVDLQETSDFHMRESYVDHHLSPPGTASHPDMSPTPDVIGFATREAGSNSLVRKQRYKEVGWAGLRTTRLSDSLC